MAAEQADVRFTLQIGSCMTNKPGQPALGEHEDRHDTCNAEIELPGLGNAAQVAVQKGVIRIAPRMGPTKMPARR